MAFFKESTIKRHMFPVGYVMITVTNTNPSEEFGGTWISIGSGKTLVGVDTEDSDYNTVEKTGGSKSKTLITDNLPSHDHTIAHTHTHSHTHARGTLRIYTSGGGIGMPFDPTSAETSGPLYTSVGSSYGGMNSGSSHKWGKLWFDTNKTGTNWSGATADASSTTTSGASVTNSGSVGSGTAFDVKNPYLTVYFWKKTA